MKQYNQLTQSIVDELKKIVGEKNVFTDPEKMQPYSYDEGVDKAYYHMPDAVVYAMKMLSGTIVLI